MRRLALETLVLRAGQGDLGPVGCWGQECEVGCRAETEAGADFAILIDAGRHTANDVVPYLQSVGITALDLLVGTHPHADHIGQFPQVLQNFTVNEVWLSGDLHTTLTFGNAIDAIEAEAVTEMSRLYLIICLYGISPDSLFQHPALP